MKRSSSDSVIKAVLGPTNTGKTHLAIERMCGHSSGMMGFPLRLLAREVYDRVCTIKGTESVALITGEERIEPPKARYFCCTAEAMPVENCGPQGEYAFVALDEAQLAADPERGHIFTDRLLHARGREETMLLGSATLEPLVRALVPEAALDERPRFSTLTHAGSVKLSRLPARSAVIAFSAEQVYAMAEMLRRFRGGAAVVMGALSPETRNKQVELFQNGEVDYIVASDAIGMGLNLDLDHVAFASLTKFDGNRKRRLTPAEMAQIAGRAGRHQRDGSFGTISGLRGDRAAAAEFTEEEIYAIEGHRFQPLTHLFWRNAEPSFDTIAALIAELEQKPDNPHLRAAPEAIDLNVLKRLAQEPFAQTIGGRAAVKRFWEACSLPDFRQIGLDSHSRFVTRLWQDLRGGYLGADYVAARIAEIDCVQGDIHALQGRIASIRSWAYICQRPDWVLARDEMGARARAVEAKLSDALHTRLTERFVNRRTTLLMKSMGEDGAALPVRLEKDGRLAVEDEVVGRLDGFRFIVDPSSGLADRKMLLAAGERALPGLLGQRARFLLAEGIGELAIKQGAICWGKHRVAAITVPDDFDGAQISLARELFALDDTAQTRLKTGLAQWLEPRLDPLGPMRNLAQAARDPDVGSQARALLHTLVAGGGMVTRKNAGLHHLPKELRPILRRLGVTFGALDIFAPALLKPAPRKLLHSLKLDKRALQQSMLPVIAVEKPLPAGYRPAGDQAIRIDLAEKIIRAAFDARSNSGSEKSAKSFFVDPALAISIGLEEANFRRLLGLAGFHYQKPKPLDEAQHGPPSPYTWHWRPRRKQGAENSGRHGPRQKGKSKNKHRSTRNGPAKSPGAFDALAQLIR